VTEDQKKKQSSTACNKDTKVLHQEEEKEH